MRTLRLVAPLVAALILTCLAPLAAAPADARAKPGPSGPGLVLDRDASYLGFDVATDAAGTSYVGWISTHPGDDLFNQVHLCVLPVGATQCSGGVQTISALEKVSAEQLFVVAGDAGATLIWHHMAGESATDDPMQDRIATAPVIDGVLGTGTDVALAPSDSTLVAVAPGPRGIGAVVLSGPDDDSTTLYHYDTLAATPVAVRAPYSVGTVGLADDGTSTVMTIGRYAEPYAPLLAARKPSGAGAWSGFAAVAGTRTDYDTSALVTTERGIRLVATSKKSPHGRPLTVTAAWKGTRFAKPVAALTQTCATGGRDAATDASGRLTSVSMGCDTLALGNHPAGGAGALTEFSGGLAYDDAQVEVATSPSGRGWVAWLGAEQQSLVVRPFVLPALTRTATTRSAVGRLTVTAPVSCLPPVRTEVGAQAVAKAPWRTAGTTLRLGGKKVGRHLDGSRLKPGRTYTLKASATFTHGAAKRELHRTVRFSTCDRP